MTITINGSGDINATGNDIELNSTGTTDVTLAVGGGSVGVGTATPDTLLEVSGASGNASIKLSRSNTASTNDDFGSIVFENSAGTTLASIRGVSKSGNTEAGITFGAGGSDATRLTLDNSGNLLVGTTDTSLYNNTSGGGLAYRSNNELTIAAETNPQFIVNNTGSDGEMIRLARDGSTVGNIGSISGSYLYIGDAGAVGMGFIGTAVRPVTDGANADNVYDLGVATVRWDDIYATNGTIQTSDANEKQDVAELDEAEKRVATAAKGLIRKFRWIDKVEEKGDDARIHIGVIAQDLKAAFEAEGLDPGRYAMFISTTWWEVDETYTDDEGVEQTRTNTYDTVEEAPEGAVERTRLGVRYSELLAFIIGAL